MKVVENEINKRIKYIAKHYSFSLQNCHDGFLPDEKGDYVYFLKTGLKGIEEKIPPDLLKQERFGKNTRFIRVGGEEKLKTKSKLIKIKGNFLTNEEEIGKKIALFLDKKVINLLQKNACPPKKEVSQYLPSDLEIRKYYKLMFLLRNSISFFKHDPRCVHQTFIEAKNLVFLLNPKVRPKRLFKQLSNKNENWFWRETFLRHITKSGGSNETGSRDILTCKLVPKNLAFITYEYNALWLWFDIKSTKKVGEEFFTTISYCVEVVKKCVFCYPLDQYSKINKS